MFNLSFVIADNHTSEDAGDIVIDDTLDSTTDIDKAYACLDKKVEDLTCSKLSTEQKIFTVLAIQKCSSELTSDSNSNECWPKNGCNIKTTAQSVLALERVNKDTSDAEDWLLSHNSTPTDVQWFLQIESSESTTCSISYEGSDTKRIAIGSDRKISSSAGSCLSLSEGNYWLRVSPTCYDKEFEVSCDKGFSTNLLYKKKTSSTIYVSADTQSSSSEGTTTEKVNSLCFSAGSTCDYEGSLWAAIVSNKLGHDISAFLPYIITMADETENKKYLPEAFIDILTGYSDSRIELLSKQKDQFWDESGDKFYDTALALYALTNSEPPQKTASKNWLLEIQGNDGCWNNGNIRNTAFLLYSIWPRTSVPDDDLDCEDEGNYCMSSITCNENGGNVLHDYDCAGSSKCCDTPKSSETCDDLNGEICNSREICVSGDEDYTADDLESGQVCCIEGYCQEPEEETECEIAGETCRSSCREGEEETNDYDCDSGDVCCIEKAPGPSYAWVWILVFLIALVVLGIIYRDKLRPFWFKIKSKFGGKATRPNSGPRPGPPRGFPPSSSRIPMRRPMPRRILPPAQHRAPPRQPPRHSGEMSDVLKKLKEMGK